jgi:hypothetical protein
VPIARIRTDAAAPRIPIFIRCIPGSVWAPTSARKEHCRTHAVDVEASVPDIMRGGGGQRLVDGRGQLRIVRRHLAGELGDDLAIAADQVLVESSSPATPVAAVNR